MAEIREEIVTRLVDTRKFGSVEAAQLGERAGWRCEYCDLDMLASVENYKLWQTDHIIPRCEGGLEEFDNLALACVHCNWHFKGTWDPRTASTVPFNPNRDDLISAARTYVHEKRHRILDDLMLFREIVGHPLAAALNG